MKGFGFFFKMKEGLCLIFNGCGSNLKIGVNNEVIKFVGNSIQEEGNPTVKDYRSYCIIMWCIKSRSDLL